MQQERQEWIIWLIPTEEDHRSIYGCTAVVLGFLV